jgi:hypothetical protein
MSAHVAHSTPTNGTSTKKSTIGIVLALLGIIIFLALAKFFFFSSNKNDGKIQKTEVIAGNSSQNSNSTSVAVYSNVIEVDFGPNYDAVTKIPRGCNITFAEATEPYTVINRDGKDASGGINEDASGDLPGGSANTELRFKSQNGGSGHIKIIVKSNGQ